MAQPYLPALPSNSRPLPKPFHHSRPVGVARLGVSGQQTKVTGAETETKTQWQVGPNGQARPVDQQTVFTDLDTETRTQYGNRNASRGIGLDEFVRSSGVTLQKPAPEYYRPGQPVIVGQRTQVVAAQTLTQTHWAVNNDGCEPEAVAVAQRTQVEKFDTKTKTQWVLNQDINSLPVLKGLLGR